MDLERVTVQGTTIAIRQAGSGRKDSVHFVWAHGWGCSSLQLLPLAESLASFGYSSLIDFPGFGESPPPPGVWGTAEYSDAVAQWLERLPQERRVWIGHSFGCRVGIQLSARHPGLLNGMVLIAAAGLRPRRKPLAKVKVGVRRNLFKAARLILSEGPRLDWLRARMGSSDYRNAGPLRAILTRVVNEDLASEAKAVECPTLLIYGSADQDTPLELGGQLNRLIRGSRLITLEGFNHHNILTEGRHQLSRQILQFVDGVKG